MIQMLLVIFGVLFTVFIWAFKYGSKKSRIAVSILALGIVLALAVLIFMGTKVHP